VQVQLQSSFRKNCFILTRNNLYRNSYDCVVHIDWDDNFDCFQDLTVDHIFSNDAIFFFISDV